ncbi:hypothetical protein BU14_0856s0001 [Porphyra umbilicalis]|uniref:SWIM-type domain-containing protein n=1 Tax=Porphyra umbilicalis TaxID=2786 RepID=A0A1X6NNU0_PORUM|nr:hypothetical protein BU14_0856s0001 [Porphyra umbilicalis]|eukprot:OSX70200.1 hypothetical protein BU14_0856s0001 [Porphyra umbilicalis]
MGRAATGKAVKPPTADKMAERLDRAASERMFFMGRVSEGTGILQPFVVTGLSGKVYTINLSTEESAASDAGSVGIGAKCNCPDFIFRRASCKHILFILLRVLAIPKERLLSALSPPRTPLTHSEVTAAAAANDSAAINPFYTPPKGLADRLRAIAGDFSGAGSSSGAAPAVAVPPRVPDPEDDCPICYEAFGEVASSDDPAVVYCRRGCGGGVHADCHKRWKDSSPGPLTCVYCRAPWGPPAAAATPSNLLLDRSGGGRGRLIDLENYMPEPEGDAPKRKSRAKKSAPAGSSAKGKGKGKGKAAAAGSSSKQAAPVESDSEVEVVAASKQGKGRTTRQTKTKATAEAVNESAAPARRTTRASGASSSRRPAPKYVELSDSDGTDDGDGDDDADVSDAPVDVDDDEEEDASPSPPKAKRTRRR